MAKKADHLKLREYYDKAKDQVLVTVYDGKAKAGKQQRQRFISENFDNIDAEKLAPAERGIYKKIESSKFRLRDKKGRFVTKDIQSKFEKSVNITYKVQKEGFKNSAELFNKDRNLWKNFQRIGDEPLPIKYNHQQLEKLVQEFDGQIYLGDKKATNLQAIQGLIESNEMLFQAAQTVGLRWIDYKVTFNKKRTELYLTFPTQEIQDIITDYSRRYNLKTDKEGRDKLVEELNKKLANKNISLGIYEPEPEEEELEEMDEDFEDEDFDQDEDFEEGPKRKPVKKKPAKKKPAKKVQPKKLTLLDEINIALARAAKFISIAPPKKEFKGKISRKTIEKKLNKFDQDE